MDDHLHPAVGVVQLTALIEPGGPECTSSRPRQPVRGRAILGARGVRRPEGLVPGVARLAWLPVLTTVLVGLVALAGPTRRSGEMET